MKKDARTLKESSWYRKCLCGGGSRTEVACGNPLKTSTWSDRHSTDRTVSSDIKEVPIIKVPTESIDPPRADRPELELTGPELEFTEPATEFIDPASETELVELVLGMAEQEFELIVLLVLLVDIVELLVLVFVSSPTSKRIFTSNSPIHRKVNFERSEKLT